MDSRSRFTTKIQRGHRTIWQHSVSALVGAVPILALVFHHHHCGIQVTVGMCLDLVLLNVATSVSGVQLFAPSVPFVLLPLTSVCTVCTDRRETFT